MKKRQSPTNPTLFDCMTKQEKAKNSSLKRRYGITLEQYNEMLIDQDNKCFICGKKHKDERYGLCVDHSHLTGKVRGLLCCYCNRRVVGRVMDDYKRMKGFLKYLKKQFKEDKKWKRLSDARNVKKKKT